MEKRKEARVRKRILSRLEDKAAIVVDISRGGIRISMSRPPKYQNIDIKLQIGDRIIELKGDVRWITRMISSQSSNNIGIAIREAPPEYYELLQIRD